MNQLDLAKVGKSFGFSVPPRVNVNIGGGKGGTGRSGKKRKREEGDDEENDEEWEEIDAVDKDASEAEAEDGEDEQRSQRRNNKERRKETLGRRKVEKEVYKKGRDRKRQSDSGVQWSR